MGEVSILLKHSGVWVEENVYAPTAIDGVVVREDINYALLRDTIAMQLHIDQTQKDIRLRYVVEGSSVPMEIQNDMGVKMFVSFVKNIGNVTKYPLCVDESEVEVLEVAASTGVGQICGVGPYDMVESGENCMPLMVVEPHTDLSLVRGRVMKHSNVIENPNHLDIKVKDMYLNKRTLVSVVHRYALRNRFQFSTKKSCRERYTLACHTAGCPWFFRASKLKRSDVFVVREFIDCHTCPLGERRFGDRHATSNFVAGECIEQLRDYKRKHTPSDIKSDMMAKMGVAISYSKAWRAREIAHKMLLGGPAEGYLRLPVYLHVLGQTFPGSYLRYEKTEENHFMYLFIALGVSIQGFQHCRPIIVVDGAYLRGPFLGTFVSASTLDGAGNIFPLAYGVIDSESDTSWTWFLSQFKAAFGVRPDMAIVSDRNESIWKSVRHVYPELVHFACMWHVLKNVCSRFKKSRETLSHLYYKMAKCYRRDHFEKLMQEVATVDSRVKEYLEEVGYSRWARCYAPVNRGRMTTSNIAECINGCLKEARKLPLLELLDKARELFGRWNQVNGDKARYMSAERLGTTFHDILLENDTRSVGLQADRFSDNIYSLDDARHRYVVCLKSKTCTCNRFQYDGIPCQHAIAILKSKNEPNLISYCSEYYKKHTLERICETPFMPMPLKNEWAAPESVMSEALLPPTFKRPAGRPRDGRAKSSGEKHKVATNRCGKCERVGHNRRGCAFHVAYADMPGVVQ